MHVLRGWGIRRAAALGAVALLGCSGASEPSEADERARLAGAAYTVRVVNDGAVELRDVVVHVSNADSIRASRLAPGASTAVTPVSVVHATPATRATVGGRLRALIPVEGFDGFNPPLEPGRYTLTIAAGTGEQELVVGLRRE
jgi:hypothetical protein